MGGEFTVGDGESALINPIAECSKIPLQPFPSCMRM